MAKRKEGQPPAPSNLGFEAALAELETIIDRIEQGEVGLEESIQQYRRGAALVGRCRSILDSAEQEVERISAEELAGRLRRDDASGGEGLAGNEGRDDDPSVDHDT